MTITRAGYFKCRYCKDENGLFNEKTGNHISCEKHHPATPRKLQTAIRIHKTQHPIARALGVNPYYINRWMKYGEEPRNADIRKRMGFKPLRKKHNGRSGFAELPEEIQWWRKLPKDERAEWIRSSYEVHRAKARHY